MKRNNFDDDDLSAFVLNESRVSIDDREMDEMEPDEHEFDPSRIFGEDTDCNGNCFSDADNGL